MVFIEDYLRKFTFTKYPENEDHIYMNIKNDHDITYQDCTLYVNDQFRLLRDCDFIYDIKVDNKDAYMETMSCIIKPDKNGYFPYTQYNPLLFICLAFNEFRIHTSKPITLTYKKCFLGGESRRYVATNKWLQFFKYPINQWYVCVWGIYHLDDIKTKECQKNINKFNKVISNISMTPDFGFDYLIAAECFESIIS